MNKDDNVIDLSSSSNNNDNTMNYKTNISDNTKESSTLQNQTESDVKVIQSFEIENENNNQYNNYEDTVYGNHISISKPLHLGKLRCLFYIHGQPLIVLGKDKCKSLLLLT